MIFNRRSAKSNTNNTKDTNNAKDTEDTKDINNTSYISEASNINSQKITFELVDGERLLIFIDWTKGSDLDLFGNLLKYLCQGKLTNAIISGISAQAEKLGDLKQGGIVINILQNMNTDSNDSVEEDPVVCPTSAIRLNTKSFN